jgi:hypothetical protein
MNVDVAFRSSETAQLYISLDKQPSHIQFRLEGVGNYINWINIFTAQTHKTRAHLSTLNSIQPTWFSLVNLYNNVDRGAYPATFTILNFEWLTCQSLNCIRSKHNNNYYYWPTPAAAAVMPELRNEFGGARSDRWAPLTHSVIQRAYYKTFLLSYFGNPNIRYTHTHWSHWKEAALLMGKTFNKQKTWGVSHSPTNLGRELFSKKE